MITVQPSRNTCSLIKRTTELENMFADYGKVILTNQHQRSHDPNEEIDPDSNFYFNGIYKCGYYTDEKFNKDIKMGGNLSIVHFNSRSLYANFDHIQDYLLSFANPFNIIAVSETWLNEDKGTDFYLEGYKFVCKNRRNKSGGGAALFIEESINFVTLENMSIVVENVMECVTIEISMLNGRKIVICCVYRAPDSKVEVFSECLSELITKLKQKNVFICGDFNIDLINPNNIAATNDFINTMYASGLNPLITRPSRITNHSATLIDNIFTNVLDIDITSGLMINDISDHLPIFAICDWMHTSIHKPVTKIFKRIRSENRLKDLEQELMKQNWNNVFTERDTNRAYEAFLDTLHSLYDKHCPVVKTLSKKNKNKEKRPWITKSLANACKKKKIDYTNSFYGIDLKRLN